MILKQYGALSDFKYSMIFPSEFFSSTPKNKRLFESIFSTGRKYAKYDRSMQNIEQQFFTSKRYFPAMQ